MNVPKLRFKEFTDVWKEYPLKYFTTPIKRKNTNNESDLPLTISSLDGLVDQRTYFNKVVASKDMSNYYLLKKGEFAYNKSYSVGFPFGSIKRLDKYNQGALSSLYICFQVNNMNSDFIVKYFESPKWHKQISLCVAEGARNHGLLNVNINDFFSTKHFLPQLAEQEKIANFLAIVDKKITNLENIITSLENQKKGLLQQIFSQKLRFKDKNGNNYPNWEKENLSTYTQFLQGVTYSPNDISSKGILVLRSSNIKNNKIVYTDNVFANININKELFVQEYDILMCVRNGSKSLVGKSALITKKDLGNTWGAFMMILRNKLSNKYNNIFIYYYLNTSNFSRHIFKDLSTATINQITKKMLESFYLYIPCLEEQTKIADFLSAFDRKLENQKAQLEHWKQIKKGLLQQMFV